MNKLLVATTNQAKKLELLSGLSSLQKNGWEILTLKDLNITDDPEETGKTFEENALLKAMYYGEKTGLPTLADDGGLMIDALGGEPGVKSRRWKGYECTDQELIEYALEKLQGIPLENRTAKLQTCLCFYNPQTKFTASEEEPIEGYIAEKRLDRETNGYPYRVLFIVKKYHKFYDEMTPDEHDEENHRLKALRRLLVQIERNLLQ